MRPGGLPCPLPQHDGLRGPRRGGSYRGRGQGRRGGGPERGAPLPPPPPACTCHGASGHPPRPGCCWGHLSFVSAALAPQISGYFGSSLHLPPPPPPHLALPVPTAPVRSPAVCLCIPQERAKAFSSYKDYLGKDITSLVILPVWIMQPFTMLQVGAGAAAAAAPPVQAQPWTPRTPSRSAACCASRLRPSVARATEHGRADGAHGGAGPRGGL